MVVAAIVAAFAAIFNGWVTDNPPSYHENVPVNTATLLLQGYAVHARNKQRMQQLGRTLMDKVP